MRKYALLAAAAAMAVSGSVAQADFMFQTKRTSIATGMFTGDDLVELDVQNTGANGTGTTLLAATVTFESVNLQTKALDPNAQFFIRTYDADGTGIHNGDATDNDMDASGIGQETPLGTYARFGSVSQWTQAGAVPDPASSDDPNGPHGGLGYPASGKYTDGQSLSTFTVIGGANLTSGGVTDTSFKPLAFAVVPAGQEVDFTVNAAGAIGASFAGVISTPEPVSLGLLGIGTMGLLVRRRRA